jgi:hypothetical protein
MRYLPSSYAWGSQAGRRLCPFLVVLGLLGNQGGLLLRLLRGMLPLDAAFGDGRAGGLLGRHLGDALQG